MLFNIVNPKDDDSFKRFVEHIKKAYWPEAEFKNEKRTEKLRNLSKELDEDKIIEQITKAFDAIADDIYKDKEIGLYVVTSSGDGRAVENGNRKLPFADRFHKLFLKRQYNCPVRNPIDKIDEFIRLEKPKSGGGNYSKNEGNFNHFVNVVMAAARLIQYLKDNKEIAHIFLDHPSKEPLSDELKKLCETLAYQNEPNIRTFKLMLAAFYHDIGKSIVNHRHGMEGAFIIADQTTQSLFCLNDIIQKYKPGDKWNKDDLLSIADFLYYHDFFGTLGTGESSYILLADILDKIKRYSLMHMGTPDKVIERSQRDLFDLWILNMADIMVSRVDKWKLQNEIWCDSEKAWSAIKSFFKEEDGDRHVHDLRIALRLLEEHNKATHTDDTFNLEQLGQKEAKNHAVERIRRLVCSTLTPALADYLNNNSADFSPGEFIGEYSVESLCEAIRKDGLLSAGNTVKDINTLLKDTDLYEQLKKKYNQQPPSDILEKLKQAYDKTKLERDLDRLNRRALEEFYSPICPNRLLGRIKMENLIEYIAKIPPGSKLCEMVIRPGFMNTVINRCIQSLSDQREFYSRFSWIGCMDYSLGFFKKIAQRAINRVEAELNSGTISTGWIRSGSSEGLTESYLDETNAMFFLDNYYSIVVRILGYLLFRERSSDKLCNIEFEDSTERLTNEKIDKIMAIEGPYRASRSIALILKTVFVY